MTNLKKAAISSILILLVLIGVAIISFAGNTGIVTKEAKLRKTASNDAIILEIIPKKEEVEILEEMDNWYKVKYNKIKGYVQKDSVEVEKAKGEENQIQENNQITEEGTVEAVAKPTVQENTAITKEEEVVYARPLINSLELFHIEKGKTVTIMSTMNNWVYVTTDTSNGWMMLDALEPVKAEDNSTVSTDTTPKEEPKEDDNQKEDTSSENLNKTGYISSAGINFRKEPNTDAEILRVFIQGSQVTILSEQGNWYKAKYKEEVGYVLKTYVSDKKVETTSRSSVSRDKTAGITEQKEETKATETTKTENKTAEKTTSSTSNKGKEVADYAKQFVGRKYVYGGTSPKKGFDCSGLTMYVYKQFGISLSHSATAQSKVGTKVSRSDLQPGDLVFFKDYQTNKGIGHVGIYIGGNQFVHASTEKTGVIISSITGSHSSRYVTATRLF